MHFLAVQTKVLTFSESQNSRGLSSEYCELLVAGVCPHCECFKLLVAGVWPQCDVVSCLGQGCGLSVSGASCHLLIVNGSCVFLPSGFTTTLITRARVFACSIFDREIWDLRWIPVAQRQRLTYKDLINLGGKNICSTNIEMNQNHHWS